MTDFVTVTDGTGDTPATDVRLQSVPEMVALLGLAVMDALRAGNGQVRTYSGGSVDINVYVDDLRPRLRYLLTQVGAFQ